MMMTPDNWGDVVAMAGAQLLETGKVRIHIGVEHDPEKVARFAVEVAEWCGFEDLDIAAAGPGYVILTRHDQRKWAAQWN